MLSQDKNLSTHKSVPELLAGLDRDALLGWIIKMVEHSPDLLPWLETQLRPTLPTRERRPLQVSEPTYRKQINSILRAGRREDQWGGWGGIAYDFNPIYKTAIQFLETGAPADALVILQVLMVELADEYEDLSDHEGQLGDFIESLGMPMAEAVLSLDLSPAEIKSLRKKVDHALEILSNYSIEGLDVVLDALDQGWNLTSESEDEYAELNEARLNVLKRQGRMTDYLELCQKVKKYRRYILALIEQGQIAEASQAALAHLTHAADALEIAKILHSAGRLPEAIALAEHGLTMPDNQYALGTWLGPIEESQGRPALALRAYRAAFDASPNLDLYRHLQRLSGAGWTELKPELIERLKTSPHPGVLAGVYLIEQEWDAAIAIAEHSTGIRSLLEMVAEGVIVHRPEWVIQVSRREAETLIAKTQSNLYPAAAAWLIKMKKACHAAGQTVEWQTYFTALKNTYSRRPALRAELKKIE